MARNNGVTVRSAVQKLSDVAVVQLVGLVAQEYAAYLKAVESNPAGAVVEVSKAARTFRQHLSAALGGDPVAVAEAS